MGLNFRGIHRSKRINDQELLTYRHISRPIHMSVAECRLATLLNASKSRRDSFLKIHRHWRPSDSPLQARLQRFMRLTLLVIILHILQTRKRAHDRERDPFTARIVDSLAGGYGENVGFVVLLAGQEKENGEVSPGSDTFVASFCILLYFSFKTSTSASVFVVNIVTRRIGAMMLEKQ